MTNIWSLPGGLSACLLVISTCAYVKARARAQTPTHRHPGGRRLPLCARARAPLPRMHAGTTARRAALRLGAAVRSPTPPCALATEGAAAARDAALREAWCVGRLLQGLHYRHEAALASLARVRCVCRVHSVQERLRSASGASRRGQPRPRLIRRSARARRTARSSSLQQRQGGAACRRFARTRAASMPLSHNPARAYPSRLALGRCFDDRTPYFTGCVPFSHWIWSLWAALSARVRPCGLGECC